MLNHSSSEARPAGAEALRSMKKLVASQWQEKDHPRPGWVIRIVANILALGMFTLAFVILFGGW